MKWDLIASPAHCSTTADVASRGPLLVVRYRSNPSGASANLSLEAWHGEGESLLVPQISKDATTAVRSGEAF